MELEIRRTQHYPAALCEIRAGGDGESPKLAGLGAPYGVWSEDLGGGFGKFRERFEAGAFRESVAADDIRALYNHESGQVLGRVSAGTLWLNETERGIEYEIDLPDTSFARDLAVSVGRKDVTGNSFGFTVPDPDTDQRWEERDGTVWRTITRAKMRELGPQPFPAYPQTDVESRSLRSVLEQARKALGPHGVSAETALRLLELDEEDAALYLAEWTRMHHDIRCPVAQGG